MNTARASFAALVGLMVVFSVACGSDGSDDDAADDGDEPRASSTVRPTRTPSGARATATKEGAGAPKFAPGDWTSGEAEARVTGDATLTVRGTLNDQANTDRDTTRLIYVKGTDTISISISQVYEPFAMSVFQGRTDVGSNFDVPCTVNYTDSSEKKVAGSFRCEKAEVSGAGAEGEATIEGTFTASR